jgi:hypothetical protein
VSRREDEIIEEARCWRCARRHCSKRFRRRQVPNRVGAVAPTDENAVRGDVDAGRNRRIGHLRRVGVSRQQESQRSSDSTNSPVASRQTFPVPSMPAVRTKPLSRSAATPHGIDACSPYAAGASANVNVVMERVRTFPSSSATRMTSLLPLRFSRADRSHVCWYFRHGPPLGLRHFTSTTL